MGKEGVIINVDPNIVRENVIKKNGEEFLSEAKDGEFDLIFLKYCLHFVKDVPAFFQNAYRTLKPTGKIVIHQLTKETVLPYTPRIAQLNY